MTYQSKEKLKVERLGSEKGLFRKRLEKHVKDEVKAWLNGRPGDLCMGEIYNRFYKDGN